MGTRVPTINVLSKNKKTILKKSSENEHFYSREILLYIAWACFRNAPFCGVSLTSQTKRLSPKF